MTTKQEEKVTYRYTGNGLVYDSDEILPFDNQKNMWWILDDEKTREYYTSMEVVEEQEWEIEIVESKVGIFKVKAKDEDEAYQKAQIIYDENNDVVVKWESNEVEINNVSEA